MTAPGTKVAKATKPTITVPDNTPNSITALLDKALDKDVSPEALEKLVTLYERVHESNARAAFFVAMAEFRKRCPPIPKDKVIDYTTRSGVRINFQYAPLPTIAREIDPLCAELGLSYTWDSKDAGGKIESTCIVRHIAGHSERASFACPTANSNPGMSDQQKQSSANTFAQRQSLIQAFGLTSVDPDDDAVAAEGSPAPITEDQAVEIEDLLEATKVDRARFLKWLAVGAVAEIRANDYQRAVATLKQKAAK